MYDPLKGISSGLDAIAKGQQYRQREQEHSQQRTLQDVVLKQQQSGLRAMERKEGQVDLSDELSKQATKMWKDQDQRGYRTALGELAQVDPNRANALSKTWSGLDKSNFVEAAYNLQASAIAPDDDQEGKNILIKRAMDTIGDPDNPIYHQLQTIMNTEPGEKRDQLEFEGIEFARKMGAFPEDRVGTSGKTKSQIERELAVKERQAQTALDALTLRREEQGIKQDQQAWERSRLTPSGEKILEKVDDRVFENEKVVGVYETLAQDMDRLETMGVKGGVVRTAREVIADLLGSHDEASLIYRKFRGLRASGAIKNLPPGVASDKDINLALSGTPKPDSEPKDVASWLRGSAKVAKMDSIYHKQRSKYLSREKTLAGFTDFWDRERNRFYAEALGMTEEQVKGGREAIEGRVKRDIGKRYSDAEATAMPTFENEQAAIDGTASMKKGEKFRIGNEVYEVE